MVSDNDMGMEGGNTNESEESSGVMSEESMSSGSRQDEEMPAVEETASEATAKPKAKGGGRRAALKIIRQNVESLSRDLSAFRKTNETGTKKLEKQVSSLRNDLNALKSYIAKESARARSKQEASFSKIISRLNAPKPKPKKAAAPKKKSKPRSKGKK